MVLAFVLGAILENNVRRSMIIYDGDPTGFVTDPISGTILAAFLVVALWPLGKKLLARRTPRPAGGDTTPTEPGSGSTDREDSLR